MGGRERKRIVMEGVCSYVGLEASWMDVQVADISNRTYQVEWRPRQRPRLDEDEFDDDQYQYLLSIYTLCIFSRPTQYSSLFFEHCWRVCVDYV